VSFAVLGENSFEPLVTSVLHVSCAHEWTKAKPGKEKGRVYSLFAFRVVSVFASDGDGGVQCRRRKRPKPNN
jgi:hypothetical protein